MIAGLALLVTALVLRAATVNHYVKGRLTASAVAGIIHLLIAAALAYGRLSQGMQTQLRLLLPLLLAFAILNALVALVINPWRVDRLPDRFPTIVQDAIVIVLFAFVATLLLQDRIFAATAAGAVVIGLALQGTLGNLFAGLAIQIEKPFRVGHWVRIADLEGMVTEINWRATRVRTKSGNFVVVPNSKVADDIIVNYSEPTLETRIEVDVGASYDVPPNEVKATILNAIRDQPLLLAARTPEVLLLDFAASSITYRLRVWTTHFSEDERLRDQLRTEIYYAFRRRNIEIPYPIQVEISRSEKIAGPGIGDDAEAVLRTVDVFKTLSDSQHAELVRATARGLYARGDTIVQQGESGASMFVVLKGGAVVTLDPEQREVARIGPGGFFGEMSLLTGAPRMATVKTTEDSELLEITADAFRHFVMANPSAVDAIGHAVEARSAEVAQLRAATTSSSGAETPQSLVNRIRRFLRLT